MDWNICDRWLAKAVSPGGAHIVQTEDSGPRRS